MQKKYKVLVTSIGGPTAIGVMKCLRDKPDIEIIGTDIRPESAGNAYCSKIRLVHRITSPEYIEEIRRIVREDCIDAIIPTMQDEITLFHEQDPGCYVALPTSGHYDCLTNKHMLYEYLQEDFSQVIPRYVIYADNSELLHIRETMFKEERVFCVKGTSGHGGLGFAVLSDNEDVLVNALENGKDKIQPLNLFSKTKARGEMMALEYLHGREYSVDVLVDDGQVVACLPRLRSRVSTGIVIEGVVEKNDALIDLAGRIACRLIEGGFINLQFIIDGEKIKLIDLNARFCGSQVHSMGAGVNFPYLLLQRRLMGVKEKVQPLWGTRMIRYWESVFFRD